jgi:hypothetical protein
LRRYTIRMFDDLNDDPEPANKSTGTQRTGSKYEFDVTHEEAIALAEVLKQRQDEGFKPKAKIALREDHEDAPPSVEDHFLENLGDDVVYVGYRRDPSTRNTSLSQEEYDDTETSEFTEGMATELWRLLTARGGAELQEMFGGSLDEPAGRIHAGHPQGAGLDEREYVVFKWRDTEHARTNDFEKVREEYEIHGADGE